MNYMYRNTANGFNDDFYVHNISNDRHDNKINHPIIEKARYVQLVNINKMSRPPPIRLLPRTVNNYVPDPKDPLDVEVSSIVNSCPLIIKVTRVDGEHGKYMFGEVEPKLCYCRLLRNKMVMVRVGGGWAELSR